MAVQLTVFLPVCEWILKWSQNDTDLGKLVHLIFSFTKIFSFMLLALDLILISFLTLHAYKDGTQDYRTNMSSDTNFNAAESLERYELPLFGRLANSFVDAE